MSKRRKKTKNKVPFALPLKEGGGYTIYLNKPKAIGALLEVKIVKNWNVREELINNAQNLFQSILENQSKLKDEKDTTIIEQLRLAITEDQKALEKNNLKLSKNPIRSKVVKLRVMDIKKKIIKKRIKYLTLLN